MEQSYYVLRRNSTTSKRSERANVERSISFQTMVLTESTVWTFRIYIVFIFVIIAMMVWVGYQVLQLEKVTAEVTAQYRYPPYDCWKENDDDRMEVTCWGAHVTFAYPWKGATRNCDMAVPVSYTQRAVDSALQTLSIGSTRSVYLTPNGGCLSTVPGMGYAFAMGVLMIFLCTVGAIQDWNESHREQEEGNRADNKKTDTPLVASAPLP